MDTTLALIEKFRKKALECRSRGMRIAYTSQDRHAAVAFVQECWARGLSAYDAAEILSIHVSTLESWIEKATRPGDQDFLYQIFEVVNSPEKDDMH